MENTIYSNSLYQISEILKYVDENLKTKIPDNLFNYIELNKSKEYNWKIDTTLPLEKQDLLQTTKELLTVIYRNYICNDIEREALDKVLNENEIKYQNELREKYSPDNIFKNKTQNIETEKVESTSMVLYKESFFSKILRKIKLLFHK